jgi:hypothetical protein
MDNLDAISYIRNNLDVFRAILWRCDDIYQISDEIEDVFSSISETDELDFTKLAIFVYETLG